ncbi:MAG: anthranilate synthase component I [Candidatus Omnitrophota bacterium]
MSEQPSLKEFLKSSKQGNVIPVYKEIRADLDTPVSAFLKLGSSDYAFLLESVEGQEKIARYSFLGSSPEFIFKSKGKNIEEIDLKSNTHKRFVTDLTPLDELKKIMRHFKPVHLKGLPRFYGGLVGYMGYDMARFFEEIPDKNPDDLKLPDCVFILTNTILIFDHVNHTIKIVANVILPQKSISLLAKTKIYNAAIKKIEVIQKELKQPLSEKDTPYPPLKSKIVSNFTKGEFCDRTNKAKSYIRKGDIIQMVMSQRFELKINKKPFDIYRKLRSLNPSPYMFFLKLKSVTLVGSSPEMLVRCEEGIVQTRPIAGTRPRGKTDVEDARMAIELINDKKERAEHLMLVDLGRNDLGRVCKPGTVKVNEFMSIEKYSHVMHLVSEVSGKLDKKHDSYSVLKASFPAGTVSGSPKIRAMEIIDELENLRRGPYAGCVGYFSFSNNMDTCITIRTIVIKNSVAYIQAGAGIVADSVPEKEHNECVNKAKALMEAVAC